MAENLTPSHTSTLAHWASYGQMGNPSEKRVTAPEWTTVPFNSPKRSAWVVPIPSDQLTKLLNGFRPSDMEDKWFVYADGPDAEGHAALHMYRSWTGYETIKLDIEVADEEKKGAGAGKTQITAITWESDEEKIKNTSEKLAKEMALEVCNWVLGVKLTGESADF
jgi:hypothetical protein